MALRGEQIDRNARIFAVADAFDAMISDRVYRAGRSYEAAVEELDKCANQHFDPQIVRAFHRVPREDWEELKRLSLLPREEEKTANNLLSTLLETRLTAFVG
jgi:HD-GYP domain-containing protein (c-di-GMP phosphodiesterase class II)